MTDNPTKDISAQVDGIVEKLTRGEEVWAETSLARRGELLGKMVELTDRYAEEWVRQAAAIKQLPEGSTLIGEEWISGPWATVSALQSLRQTIGRMAAGNDALAGFHLRKVAGGRLEEVFAPGCEEVLYAFSAGCPRLVNLLADRALLSGFSRQERPVRPEQRPDSSTGLAR